MRETAIQGKHQVEYREGSTDNSGSYTLSSILPKSVDAETAGRLHAAISKRNPVSLEHARKIAGEEHEKDGAGKGTDSDEANKTGARAFALSAEADHLTHEAGIHEEPDADGLVFKDGQWHITESGGETVPFNAFRHSKRMKVSELAKGDFIVSTWYRGPAEVVTVSEKSISEENLYTGETHRLMKQEWANGKNGEITTRKIPTKVMTHLLAKMHAAEAGKTEPKPEGKKDLIAEHSKRSNFLMNHTSKAASEALSKKTPEAFARAAKAHNALAEHHESWKGDGSPTHESYGKSSVGTAKKHREHAKRFEAMAEGAKEKASSSLSEDRAKLHGLMGAALESKKGAHNSETNLAAHHAHQAVADHARETAKKIREHGAEDDGWDGKDSSGPITHKRYDAIADQHEKDAAWHKYLSDSQQKGRADHISRIKKVRKAFDLWWDEEGPGLVQRGKA